MKSNSHREDLDPAERFVDSALGELARLEEQATDQALVDEVLSKTVYGGTHSENTSATHFDRRLWATVSVSVAAIIAIAALVLSNLPYRKNQERESTDLHFVVSFPSQASDATPISENKSSPPVAAVQSYAAQVSPVSSSPGPRRIIEDQAGSLDIITSFGQSIAALPPRPLRQDHFRITANHTSRESGIIRYSGNVVIEHNEFRIEADIATVPDTRSTDSSVEPYLDARNAIITQFSPAREARAGQVIFEPVKGVFLLTAVSSLETDEGLLNRFDERDRISLSSHGYSIEHATTAGPATAGDAAVMKYASPLPKTR